MSGQFSLPSISPGKALCTPSCSHFRCHTVSLSNGNRLLLRSTQIDHVPALRIGQCTFPGVVRLVHLLSPDRMILCDLSQSGETKKPPQRCLRGLTWNRRMALAMGRPENRPWRASQSAGSRPFAHAPPDAGSRPGLPGSRGRLPDSPVLPPGLRAAAGLPPIAAPGAIPQPAGEDPVLRPASPLPRRCYRRHQLGVDLPDKACRQQL